MNVSPEHSLLRRRRAVEVAALLGRGSGLVSTVMFLAGWLDTGTAIPAQLYHVCFAGVALMVVAEVFAVINIRRPAGPYYGWFSVAQLAVDTMVMCGMVVWFQLYGTQTTWPGLVVPIVAAALRHRLPGALITWAITSGTYVVTVVALGSRAVRPEDLPLVCAIHLVIAVISGTQSGAFARQVDQLDEIRRTLQHQANHDGLTGLPNRAHLSEYADRFTGRSLAVLLLDLNGFKQVNDTLGHAAGDLLLTEVGRRLNTDLRAGDLAGRLGGDEFLVLLPDADPATVREVTARLRADITHPIVLDGETVRVGVSIGTAYRAVGDDADLPRLTAEADGAMYRDKVLTPS